MPNNATITLRLPGEDLDRAEALIDALRSDPRLRAAPRLVSGPSLAFWFARASLVQSRIARWKGSLLARSGFTRAA